MAGLVRWRAAAERALLVTLVGRLGGHLQLVVDLIEQLLGAIASGRPHPSPAGILGARSQASSPSLPGLTWAWYLRDRISLYKA